MTTINTILAEFDEKFLTKETSERAITFINTPNIIQDTTELKQFLITALKKYEKSVDVEEMNSNNPVAYKYKRDFLYKFDNGWNDNSALRHRKQEEFWGKIN